MNVLNMSDELIHQGIFGNHSMNRQLKSYRVLIICRISCLFGFNQRQIAS